MANYRIYWPPIDCLNVKSPSLMDIMGTSSLGSLIGNLSTISSFILVFLRDISHNFRGGFIVLLFSDDLHLPGQPTPSMRT